MENNTITPRIEQWYIDEGTGLSFTVVDFDSVAGIIEVQFSDGELDELHIEEWEELYLEEIEQPEEWTGPLDEPEQDNLGYDES